MLRIALKIDMPLVASGDTDPTLTETLIPWLIRVSGDDRQTCYALVLYAHELKGYRRVAMLRVNNRYGRVGTAEFKDGLRRLGTPVILEMGYAQEAGRIVRQMREMNMKQAVLGSDRLVSPVFLDVAGAAAEGTVATYLYNPDLDDEVLRRFNRRYRERFGESAETFASHAYDG